MSFQPHVPNRFAWIVLLAALISSGAALAADQTATPRPKLVVQITVDQLRGDMITRFADRWGEGGFRRLLDEGIHYANVHYDHSTTFTAVGHATLFTGGGPAEHGIAGNDWFDVRTGRHVYCVEDDRHSVIGRKAKPHEGLSPRNLTSSTIGDEMIAATAGASKVFAVSIKDRGAILPAGHRGKAFWYDKDSGRFVTSTFYYAQYPSWVQEWNDSGYADVYVGKSWTLARDPSAYLFAGKDGRPFERPFKHMGRAFPHPLGEKANADFYAALRFTPMGDELTVKFAKALVEAEQLGADDVPDLLSISLSATDYIGHAFGPDSLEAEDNLLRLDRTLAELLKFIDEKVGAGAYVVVLSSDHGIDLIPEARCADAHDSHGSPAVAAAVASAKNEAGATAEAEHGCDAGRHYPEKFIAAINAALQSRLGAKQPLVTTFWNPSLYIDTAAVADSGLDQEAVERAVAEEALKLPGFRRAFTRTDLLAGRVAQDYVARAVAEAFHPQRSGHVMLVQAPFWYLYDKPEEFAAMHGSPYSYDTFVPLLMLGPSIAPAKVHRRVSPRDIAPTLAAYLGIAPPSGSTGAVLGEVFGEGAQAGPGSRSTSRQ